MSILGGDVVFHDKAGGGYYCNVCRKYLHPDIVPSHKQHNQLTDVVATDTKATTDTSNPPPESHKQELEDILKPLLWHVTGHQEMREYEQTLQAIETYTASKIDSAVKKERLMRLAAEIREGELIQELEPYRNFKAALQQDTSKGELDG